MARTYNIEGLVNADVEAIQRIAEIAILEALELSNSVPRVRVLLSGCSVLLKIRELTDLEQRLHAVETALWPSTQKEASK